MTGVDTVNAVCVTVPQDTREKMSPFTFFENHDIIWQKTQMSFVWGFCPYNDEIIDGKENPKNLDWR
jgi:hypothetical protein